MSNTVQAMGARLRRVRLRRGWSQRELARRVGCDECTVGGVESGEVIWSRSLEPMLDALHLTPAWLVTGVDEPPSMDEQTYEVAMALDAMDEEMRYALGRALYTLLRAQGTGA